MIAYNNEWLNNLAVQKETGNALQAQCISPSEKEQADAAYPVGFYTPNPFVRTGLFILTVVIVVFTTGLCSLLFMWADGEQIIGGLFVLFGFLTYGGLELVVNKGHYRSGVDDALLWTTGGCIVGGLNIIANISSQANAAIIFILAVWLFLRFTNAVVAAIVSLALLAIVFFSVIKLGAVAKAVAPFVLMMISALIYFFVQWQLQQNSRRHYAGGFLLISITALICFYLSGNYYVVRETSSALFNLDLKEGQGIPFGWLFWILTVATPALFIIRGLQKKDAVLLRVGLLLMAALVFTVRYYYHVIPAETAMVVGGIVLIGISYALIRYLREPKYGFTHKEEKDAFFMNKLRVESLLIVESFGNPQLPADTGTQFGGGTGGGGGASGQF